MTSRSRFVFLATVSLAVAASAPCRAQPAPRPTEAAETEKFERERELEQIRAEIARNTAAKAKVETEIGAIRTNRAKLIEAGIDAARKVRAAEARVILADDRLTANRAEERKVRDSLEDRKAVIAEVIAALQRMGRRPPPALLVAPDDVLLGIRTAMMLGLVLPDMRTDLDRVVADLARLSELGKTIARERDQLHDEVKNLETERQRLDALSAARQSEIESSEKLLDSEKLRALGLARQAGNLELLIRRMETEISAAMKAAEAARAVDPRAGTSRPATSMIGNTARIAPAIPFEEAKGKVLLPVNGTKLREYGTPDGLGGHERGLSLTTRPGAQVVAPADGWVVYAGPFRSYGQLLIINAGGGYHMVMAGMDRVSVELGQFVLAGEPVAVMGTAGPAATTVMTQTSDPVLFVEFRKDGSTIDPGPWWASSPEGKTTDNGQTRNEKVRG